MKTKPASRKLSLTPPKPAGQMRQTQTAEPKPPTIADEAGLLADLRALIQSARQRVATVANATQTLLYWHVGRRFLKENLQDGRAAYGKRILATVSRELRAEFGEGFTLRSLYRSIQFFELFPDETIVSTLSAQLSWSHFIELLPLKDPLARDPYFLDFLGLKGAYSERDLESAILRSPIPDTRHIECTLDGLLDFCGYEPALRLYKKLCRYYFHINPTATVQYVDH